MDFKQIDEVHGKNVLILVLSVFYLRVLLVKARGVRYLAGDYPQTLTELQKVAESRMLEGESKQNSPESDTPPADDAESS